MRTTTVLPAIGRVDVYPVGLLSDLTRIRAAVRAHKWHAARGNLRRIARGLRSRDRNYLNGHLAEPYHFPPGLTRCGHGWTEARARASLLRAVDDGRVDAPRPGAGPLTLELSEA